MSGPWRHPDEESVDLYPGLVVHDCRQSGSITVGQSRLPLWCFIYTAIHHGWEAVEDGWAPTEHYGFTADDLAGFLHDLLELRGEFGRLLLVLAAGERSERVSRESWPKPWWIACQFEHQAEWDRLAARKREVAARERLVADREAVVELFEDWDG